MSFRKDKITSLIKEELSLILLHKVKDPALGFVTITNVRVTPDLRIAKVYISIFAKEKRDEALAKLTEMKGFIRSELAHKIKIRFVPDLQFYIDDTADYVEKLEGLIKQIHKDDNQAE